ISLTKTMSLYFKEDGTSDDFFFACTISIFCIYLRFVNKKLPLVEVALLVSAMCHAFIMKEYSGDLLSLHCFSPLTLGYL
ncbi:hypothetical protein, partial [Vibrio parahaemolyticus]|uniref:hypothetical protein n=1 Tax=Vibrio parahaemolyticus TaxID=670 RepID=UPI001C5ECA9B